ncbi:MAG TPA: hypothetical protein V6D10_01545 [Trichocoleus sp.]|jgi:hypothetical protein
MSSIEQDKLNPIRNASIQVSTGANAIAASAFHPYRICRSNNRLSTIVLAAIK